jgi:hypothetical protein
MCRLLFSIASLTLLWSFCGRGSAEPNAIELPKDQVPRKVTGDGPTAERAKKEAVDKALELVKNLMARHQLTAFEPDLSYVRKHVLNGEGEAGDDVKADNIVAKAWVVTFRSESEWWTDLQRRDHAVQRERVASARQQVGSQVIIGLGILLLAAVGYLRLDEYTQRRHTTWLRLGGIAIAALFVGGGLWLIIRTPG